MNMRTGIVDGAVLGVQQKALLLSAVEVMMSDVVENLAKVAEHSEIRYVDGSLVMASLKHSILRPGGIGVKLAEIMRVGFGIDEHKDDPGMNVVVSRVNDVFAKHAERLHADSSRCSMVRQLMGDLGFGENEELEELEGEDEGDSWEGEDVEEREYTTEDLPMRVTCPCATCKEFLRFSTVSQIAAETACPFMTATLRSLQNINDSFESKSL